MAMHSPEDENTIERFNEALRACGSNDYLRNGLTMGSLGQVTLKHKQCEIRAYLCRAGQQPDTYIQLDDISTRQGMSNRGQGRVLLMKLFDIADAAGIETISVCASLIGVYAHAAHYAQCDPSRWDGLQNALLMNLEGYTEIGTAGVRAARQEQATAAKPIIEHSTGQLGELVDQLRVSTINMNDTRYPTLAKYLFLYEGFPRSYMAHWTPVERTMARTAFGWVTPAPIIRQLSPQLQPRPPQGLVERMVLACLKP